jgi:hypothetical protein
MFILFVCSFHYCCTGDTLWHLQKFLQRIIVEFTPPTHHSPLSALPPFLEQFWQVSFFHCHIFVIFSLRKLLIAVLHLYLVSISFHSFSSSILLVKVTLYKGRCLTGSYHLHFVLFFFLQILLLLLIAHFNKVLLFQGNQAKAQLEISMKNKCFSFHFIFQMERTHCYSNMRYTLFQPNK